MSTPLWIFLFFVYETWKQITNQICHLSPINIQEFSNICQFTILTIWPPYPMLEVTTPFECRCRRMWTVFFSAIPDRRHRSMVAIKERSDSDAVIQSERSRASFSCGIAFPTSPAPPASHIHSNRVETRVHPADIIRLSLIYAFRQSVRHKTLRAKCNYSMTSFRLFCRRTRSRSRFAGPAKLRIYIINYISRLTD